MYGERDLRQKRALDHPLRESICDLLAHGARLPATAISAELPDAPSLSQVNYHLSVLVDAELVSVEGDVGAAPVYQRS